MSLQKARPANIPYTVYPARVKMNQTELAVPAEVLERVFKKLRNAERPRVAYQDDQGAMMLEAFNLMQRTIREVVQELEPYV